MSDMNIRALLGRGRELLGRIRLGDPAAQAPETFALLALRIERDLQRQGRGRSLLVAAADDDAIGAESAAELAWSLAEDLGHSVLLVDGAFGVRALSAELGLADRPGLVELLDAPAPGADALLAAIQPTVHERIRVLPLGIGAGDRAIRVEAVRGVLAAACERHDVVLVQGSVLANGGRSMAFASLVDAALLVAVENRTTLAQVTRGQRLLNDCGAARVALVLASRPGAPRLNGG